MSRSPRHDALPALRADGTPRARNVVALVRAQQSSLQKGEQLVAAVILDEPDAVIYRSVTEVAEAAGVSTATVVRCAQRLGFRGFHDLKLALAQERAVYEHHAGEAGADDGPIGILRQVTAAGAQTVRDAGSLVDAAAFAAATVAIAAAPRLLVLGVGTSAPLAQDAGYRFRTVGVQAEAPADLHVQHVAAGMLGPGDVCLAVSHSGATRETVAGVEAASAAGATTVAITSFLRSPLTDAADIALTAGTRELSFRLEAMASRLAHMAVIDALLVAVAESDPARAQAALDLYADTLSDHRY